MNLSLSARFDQLSTLLQQTAQWWRPAAFYSHTLPWMQENPPLAQRLLALSEEAVAHLGMTPMALYDWLAPDLSFVRLLQQMCDLPMLPQRPLPAVSPRFSAGIPGRKWQQVTDFASCLPTTELPLLEWCAGKSHLGFYLQYCQQQPVTALEWDAALVQQAQLRATDECVPLQSHVVDVLSSDAEQFVESRQQAVALHACGDLHERFLQLCVKHEVQHVHVAPCCYHKRQGSEYKPLSAAGRAMDLNLNRQDLHTAVMETVTAGATVRRQRERLQTLRLGFDELQRDLRGVDAYLPLPSLPAQWARADFATFCQHCAALHQLSVPANVSWEVYWRRGQHRFRAVSALDLVRFAFRRPLEIWLLLDRALLLQEHGYHVEIGQFCAYQVTPRNMLIQAVRESVAHNA